MYRVLNLPIIFIAFAYISRVVYSVNNWTIRSEFTTNTMTDSDLTYEWSIQGSFVSSPFFTDCGKGFATKRVLGGYQKFGTDVFIVKTLQNIPPHYQSQVQLNLYFIDQWQSTESVWINSSGSYTQYKYNGPGQTQTTTDTNCGNPPLDYIQSVDSGIFAHTSSTHQIIFKSDMQEDSATASWAIRDFIYIINACDVSCQSCTQSQPTQCTGCYSNATLDALSKLCKCNAKFYAYVPAIPCIQQPCTICKNCDDSCYTCKGPFNNDCLSCAGSLYLSSNQCVATCPIGTYQNPSPNNNLCSGCDSSCFTCIGRPNPNQCTYCDTGFFLYQNQCKNSCQTHYFPNSITRTCDICDPSCNNCNGKQSDQCTDCPPGIFLDSSSTPGKSVCVAKCPNKYFGDTSVTPNICRDCNQGCSTCNCYQCTVLNICTACQSPNYLVGTKCSSCQLGYYGDPITFVCKPCNVSCASCVGGTSSDCTSCPPNNFLYVLNGSQGKCLAVCPSTPPLFGQNSMCVSQCSNSTFGDNQDPQRLCKPCNSQCNLCYGPTFDSCTKCNLGFYLYNNSCLSICPNGTYQNSSNLRCDSCDEYCGTCRGPSKQDCLTCAPPLFGTGSSCFPSCGIGEFGDLITRKCSTSCNSGYYKDSVNRICQQCNQKCLTCTGPQASNCQICKDPYYLNNGQCDFCPLFKYGIQNNDGTRVCIDCPQYCAICNNPGPTCVQCISGMYLSSNVCEKSCPVGTFADPITQSCVTDCKLGYYKDTTQNICSKCSFNCGKCYGPLQSSCYQCIFPYYLHNSQCVSSCPSGLYADNITWNCLQCPLNCSQCSKQNTCSKCKTNYLLYNQACVTQCPSNLYEREGECVESCGQGYFIITPSTTQKCGACSIFCKECVGQPTNCTSCQYELNTKLYLQDNTCQLSCNNGYFLPIGSQNTCSKCDQSCSNCTGTSQNCTACQGIYNYYKGKCVDTCPAPLQGYQNRCLNCFPGSYYDITTRTCQQCHISCKQCTGQRYDQCTVCWNYRGIGPNNAPQEGICGCQQGYAEMFDRLCQKNEEAMSKYSSVKGLSITNTVLELLFYVLSGNPVSFVIMANLGQNLNMISYLDMPYGFNLQETVRYLGKYHITQGLGAPAFNEKNRSQLDGQNTEEENKKSLKTRILYETYNTWSDKKFDQNNFTGSFLSNMLIFFCIQGFIWLFCYCLNKYIIKYELDHHYFSYHLNMLITYNLPLALFLLSYFEVIISIFLQLKQGDYSSLFNTFSFAFCFFGLLYIGLILADYIKLTNFKKPYEKPEIQFDDYNKNRIYWVYLRLNNILQRNFHLIIIIQKTIIAAILVFMYDINLVAQASIVFLTYFALLVYMIVCRPLNRKRYLFLEIFNEFFVCIIWIILISETKQYQNNQTLSSISNSFHIENIILMLFIANFLFILFEFVVNIPLLIQRYKWARSILIEQISHFLEWLNRKNIQKRQNFLLNMLNLDRKDECVINMNENKTNQSEQSNYYLKNQKDYIHLLTGHDLKQIKQSNQELDIIDLEIDEEEVNLIKQRSKLSSNNLNLIPQDMNLLEINNNKQNDQQIVGEPGVIKNQMEGGVVEGNQAAILDKKDQIQQQQLINLDLLKDKPQEKIILDKELILPNINIQRKAQQHHRVYLKDEIAIDRFRVFGEFRGNKFSLSMQGHPPQTNLNNGLYDIYEYDEFVNEVLLKEDNEDSFEVIDFMDRNQQYFRNKLDKNSQQIGLTQQQNINNQFHIYPDKNDAQDKINNIYSNPSQQREVILDQASRQVRAYLDMETQGKFKILKKKDINTGRTYTIALPLSVDIQNKRQALANKILSMKPNAVVKETNDQSASTISKMNNSANKQSKSVVLNAWQQQQPNIYQNNKKW
ncbi:hypothetical protein ABPG74_000147 [Tetrahymena malaccensis]